ASAGPTSATAAAGAAIRQRCFRELTCAPPSSVSMQKYTGLGTASFLLGILRVVLVGQVLAAIRGIRRVGRHDDLGALVLIRDLVALERGRLGIERETLDYMQLVAVRHRASKAARREADGVDDQRVAVPTADRVPRAARRDGCRM